MISDIFVPIPGVSSIDSADASMSACIERKRAARLRPVISPTSSRPTAKSRRSRPCSFERWMFSTVRCADSSP